jgi:transposase
MKPLYLHTSVRTWFGRASSAVADGRSLSPEQLAQRRLQAVELKAAGMAITDIAARVGLSRPAVYTALRLAVDPEKAALEPARRGKKKGTGSLLNEAQQAEVLAAQRKRPVHSGLKRWLWTRALIGELVFRRFQIRLSDRVLANYCSAWGLEGATGSPLERCSPAVQDWWTEHGDAVLSRVGAERAVLYWTNARGRLVHNLWGAGVKRLDRLYSVSACDQKGRLYWAVNRGPFGPERQISFFNRLLADQPRRRKVLVMRDAAATFAPDVRHWLSDMAGQIEVLPPLSAVPPPERPARKRRAPPSPPLPAFDPSIHFDDAEGGETGEGGETDDFDPADLGS